MQLSARQLDLFVLFCSIRERINILGLICLGQSEDLINQLRLIHFDPCSNQLVSRDLHSILGSTPGSLLASTTSNNIEETEKHSEWHLMNVCVPFGVFFSFFKQY